MVFHTLSILPMDALSDIESLDLQTPGYHVAYVGNLVFEATPKQLREVFKGCEVTVVRLHTDKVTGKSKGYAHVHFANEESLDR